MMEVQKSKASQCTRRLAASCYWSLWHPKVVVVMLKQVMSGGFRTNSFDPTFGSQSVPTKNRLPEHWQYPARGSQKNNMKQMAFETIEHILISCSTWLEWSWIFWMMETRSSKAKFSFYVHLLEGHLGLYFFFGDPHQVRLGKVRFWRNRPPKHTLETYREQTREKPLRQSSRPAPLILRLEFKRFLNQFNKFHLGWHNQTNAQSLGHVARKEKTET